MLRKIFYCRRQRGFSIKTVHMQEVLAAVVTAGEGVDTLVEVFKLPRI